MAHRPVSCQRCGGDGVINGQRCESCRGLGRGLLFGGYLVYWQKILDDGELREEHLRRTIRTSGRAIMFLVGLAGFLYLIIDTVLDIEAGHFTPFRLLVKTGPGALLFWTSLVASHFTYYSLERDIADAVRIPRRVYQGPGEAGASAVVDFRTYPHINIYDTLTPTAREALVRGYQLARRLGQPYQATHLFLALLSETDVRTILSRLGVSPGDVARKTLRVLGKERLVSEADFSPIFLNAYQRAYHERRLYVDVPFVFASVAALDATSAEVLYDFSIDEAKVSNVLAWQINDERLRQRWRTFRARARLRPRHQLDRAMTAVATPVLDAFSQDLTQLAQWGYFLPTVSRPAITEGLLRVIQSGRNPILVGYPGVGKRGIMEEIAERMVANDVPAVLRDKRLVSVSIPKLVSGAAAAEAEARLLGLLAEASRSGNIVLLIEDIQGMVGITSGRTGSVDLADVLAKGLSGRNCLCLATSAPEDYRRFIEGRPLASAFERVDMSEPTRNETIQIVEARVGSVEYQQGVYFSYDALARLVELCDRYIHDRYLPQKALAFLGEIAIYVREQHGVKSVVRADDVNAFVGAKLGIPVSRVNAQESDTLLRFEELLHQRVVDQEEAVVAVAEALRRARAEVRDQKRPIVNLLFLGPTGVGKTELAKAVAAVYFGDDRKMVRLDMTEYQEPSSISRLLGAPGVSGSRGVLTEAVRSSPFALVLLDEIEKAHPDVVNVFLQVMDDGRLTDTQGRTVDFTNSIIIATSNAASAFIQTSIENGSSQEELERQLLTSELRQYFPPEFLNRFDRVVVFRPLAFDHVVTITQLLLSRVTERLAEHGIAFTATPAAVTELARAGFDPLFGARPLRRTIQDRVDSTLARYLLEGRLQRRDAVTLEANGRLSIRKATPL